MICRALKFALPYLLSSTAALAIDPFYEGSNGIRAMVFETNCLACHSSQRTGVQRNGAPEGLNWDVYEVARASADRIMTRAVIQMTMPPPSTGIPPLNQEQRDAMLAWQAAGFPQAPLTAPQNPTFSFSNQTLTLPVVQVGSRSYLAELTLVRLPESPTGVGFVLRSAQPTQADSPTEATYDVATGLVTIPIVDLVEGGVTSRSVSAEMVFVQGSNPFLFMVTSITNIAQ